MGNPSRIFIASALLTLCVTPLHAQTRDVTIAWDPSPDPSVIGYVVYIGTEPGTPREHFDVSGTSFVYSNADSGRPYFFSVASYTDDRRVGDPSAEVLFLSGGPVGSDIKQVPTPVPETLPSKTASTSAVPHQSLVSRTSACPQTQGCYAIVGAAGNFDRIDAVGALGDGRLMLIEKGARILTVNPENGGERTIAAAAEDGVRFESLAVDPQFSASHFVYVAEQETLADGTSQVNVVRYRELNGTLGERASIVSALPASVEDAAAIAVDASGHLFIALPLDDSSTSYAGTILRFLTDGSIPSDNRAASPVFARGTSSPAQLVWSAATNTLWLSDRGAQSNGALFRIPLAAGTAEWPRSGDVVQVGDAALNTTNALSIVDGVPGRLIAIDDDGRGAAQTMGIESVGVQGIPTAATQDRGDIDVAIQNVDEDSTITSRIVRLRLPSSVQ